MLVGLTFVSIKKLEKIASMSVPLPFDTLVGSLLLDILRPFPAKRLFKLSPFLLFTKKLTLKSPQSTCFVSGSTIRLARYLSTVKKLASLVQFDGM